MSKLRIAFVGCGNHAGIAIYPSLRHAPVELVAVCDLDEERARERAATFGAGAVYTDYRAMFDREQADAAFVVGPPDLHREVALEALDRGLHVFLEKPPGQDLAGTRAILERSRAVGRHVMVGFMKRFALGYAKARELMAGPEFGAPTHINAKYCHWQCRGLHWHLIYMSVHMLDLVRFFVGDLERVHVERCVADGQYAFAVAAKFRNGASGLISLTAMEPRVQERVIVSGEGQMIEVDNLVDLRVLSREQSGIGLEFEPHDRFWRPDFAIPHWQQNSLFLQGYAGEVRHFAESILAGREPTSNIHDGYKAMQLVEILSRADGETVTVPDD
jgi:predicted dehydrogenase